MKTIQELNTKIWYRFIKVIFILLYVLCFVSVIGIAYTVTEPEFDKENSYIKCSNGRILSQDEYPFDSDYLIYSDDSEVKRVCTMDSPQHAEYLQEIRETAQWGVDNGKTEQEVMAAILKYKQQKFEEAGGYDMPKNYEFYPKYDPRNQTLFVGYTLGSGLIVLMFFELMRRIFYYIVLGTIWNK